MGQQPHESLMSAKLRELWQSFLRANERLPLEGRLQVNQEEGYTELVESRVGHYLRLYQADNDKLVLGRKSRKGHDLAVGEQIGYEQASGIYYLRVPRARPWSYGFDKVSLYLVDDRGIDLILRNIVEDRPIQDDLELYKVQY